VLLIGSFDGFHKGHAFLLNKAKDFIARNPSYQIQFLTFKDSLCNFFQHTNFPMLLTLEEREFLFSSLLKQKACFITPSKDFFALSAKEFFTLMLAKNKKIHLIISEESQLGCDKMTGTLQFQKLKNELGDHFSFEVMPLYKEKEDEKISSSHLRALIAKGEIKKANELTTTPFFHYGTIIKGNQKGRMIGFPTLNINYPSYKMAPPFGVYLTQTNLYSKIYKSLTYISNFKLQETLSKDALSETYLLDFNPPHNEESYGQKALVTLKEFVRPPIKIKNLEELKTLLERDKLTLLKS
jgi:riboflavin kinase/FMN adenylyltransferase